MLFNQKCLKASCNRLTWTSFFWTLGDPFLGCWTAGNFSATTTGTGAAFASWIRAIQGEREGKTSKMGNAEINKTYLFPQSRSCLRVVADLPQRSPWSQCGLVRYNCFPRQSVLILAADQASVLVTRKTTIGHLKDLNSNDNCSKSNEQVYRKQNSYKYHSIEKWRTKLGKFSHHVSFQQN